MPKNILKCMQCGKTYITYKENSKFCSRECREESRGKYYYNCDYCGVEFRVPLNKLEALRSGAQKHIYCSKECANAAQNKRMTNICEWCGGEYEICNAFKDVQKYCSRECYLAQRERTNYCKHCGEPFHPKRKEALYCSKECQISDLYPKITCQCKVCGKEIDYSPKAYFAVKNHYCSKKCKFDDIKWSDEDKAILKEWYGIKSNYEISLLLSKPYSVKAIKSAATRYKIKCRELWTEEEKNYLALHYENTPIETIRKVLSNRTPSSILGQARQCGLKSFYYYQSRWSEDEEQYLRDNYSKTKTKVIAQHLNRSIEGVTQHANMMGLEKDAEIGACYTKLSSYIRAQNSAFHLRKLKEKDFVCQITGDRGDVVLHHIYGFNLILAEAVELSGITLKRNFEDYSIEELQNIYDIFADLQDEYDSTICICKGVHVEFHKQYGYGNNTPDQWEEFIKNNYND